MPDILALGGDSYLRIGITVVTLLGLYILGTRFKSAFSGQAFSALAFELLEFLGTRKAIEEGSVDPSSRPSGGWENCYKVTLDNNVQFIHSLKEPVGVLGCSSLEGLLTKREGKALLRRVQGVAKEVERLEREKKTQELLKLWNPKGERNGTV